MKEFRARLKGYPSRIPDEEVIYRQIAERYPEPYKLPIVTEGSDSE